MLKIVNGNVIIQRDDNSLVMDECEAHKVLVMHYYANLYKVDQHKTKVIVALLRGDCYIDAVKYLRQEDGLGLRDAKLAVDRIKNELASH